MPQQLGLTVPFATVGPTRHNLCINPACGSNVTGWGGGSTPTRSTGLTVPGVTVTTGAHYSINSYAQTPSGVALPATAYTLSLYFQNNSGSNLGSKVIYFCSTRSAGGDDQSQTTTVALPIGTTRVSITKTTVALTTGVYMIVDSFDASQGAGCELTAVLFEQSASLGSYFDGNTAGASWDGTPNNSASSM